MSALPELRAPLVLASASPRRREILTRLGLRFRVRPSGVEESRGAGEAPAAFAERVAADKAAEVAAALQPEEPPAVVLGADTVVVVDDDALGKPVDDREAQTMLRSLSDRWHEVTTGLAVARRGAGVLETIAVTTQVRFRRLTDAMARAYIATGEGRDKAGGYAVQGVGSGLVRELRGSYDNVVGLPAVETLEILERHGVLGGWP